MLATDRKPPKMNEAFRPDRQLLVAARARRRRWATSLVVIAVTAAVIAAAWAVRRPHRSDDGHTIEPTPALTVTVTRPLPSVWPVTVEASGAIAAWQEASIGAQVGGYRLVEVLVNVGDQVTKGQVLARFDAALLQADETRLAAS